MPELYESAVDSLFYREPTSDESGGGAATYLLRFRFRPPERRMPFMAALPVVQVFRAETPLQREGPCFGASKLVRSGKQIRANLSPPTILAVTGHRNRWPFCVPTQRARHLRRCRALLASPWSPGATASGRRGFPQNSLHPKAAVFRPAYIAACESIQIALL